MSASDKLKKPMVVLLSLLVIAVAGWSVIYSGWSVFQGVFDDRGPMQGETQLMEQVSPYAAPNEQTVGLSHLNKEDQEYMPKDQPNVDESKNQVPGE